MQGKPQATEIINRRETGARKYPVTPGEGKHGDDGGTELEGPTVPAPDQAFGLQETLSETPEKTRKSDGQNPPRKPS
ncbi:MAG: hypothetical protein H0T56_07100 [Pseudaminobacter sp.]|nr:hypothetical protein [Pseudaminobacter sp.]